VFNPPKNLTIKVADVGQLFGIALDNANPPNIYLSARTRVRREPEGQCIRTENVIRAVPGIVPGLGTRRWRWKPWGQQRRLIKRRRFPSRRPPNFLVWLLRTSCREIRW